MAIDCSVQTIQTESKCFTCPSEKQLLGGMVYLLGQILLQYNPMAPVSADDISTASRCYTCKLSGKALQGAIVYLLCQILSNVDGGVVPVNTDYLIEGHGSPVGSVVDPPPDPTKVWQYNDLDSGGEEYFWTVEGQAWY